MTISNAEMQRGDAHEVCISDDLEKGYRDDPNGGLSSDNQTTIKRRLTITDVENVRPQSQTSPALKRSAEANRRYRQLRSCNPSQIGVKRRRNAREFHLQKYLLQLASIITLEICQQSILLSATTTDGLVFFLRQRALRIDASRPHLSRLVSEASSSLRYYNILETDDPFAPKEASPHEFQFTNERSVDFCHSSLAQCKAIPFQYQN
ncbi:hypothetical protein DL95DRAFT_403400 [Leptodontidium sp. 2 PMI_412]|nr:hypothetical protein DL95DRAFT_403400 [Leptodontidium sp. 2 PMI_412]